MKQQKNIRLSIFATRLGVLIAKEGLTQKQLAAGTGLSQSTISHYLRGTRATPRVEEVLALAAYFHVTVEWLLGADDSAPKRDPDLLRKELDLRDSELRTIITSLDEQITKLRAMVNKRIRGRTRRDTKNPGL